MRKSCIRITVESFKLEQKFGIPVNVVPKSSANTRRTLEPELDTAIMPTEISRGVSSRTWPRRLVANDTGYDAK